MEKNRTELLSNLKGKVLIYEELNIFKIDKEISVEYVKGIIVGDTGESIFKTF